MICPHCHTEFEPNSPYRVYCSDVCKRRAASSRRYHESVKRIPATRTCPRCQNDFAPHDVRQVYCGNECRDHARRAKYNEKRKSERAAAQPKDPRAAAVKAAREAMRRIETRAKSKAASKHYNGGIKPLNPKTQAAIDRVVEKAKQAGTCYGTG